MSPRHSVPIVLSFCLLVLGGVIVAGPLTPPAGPVAETDLVRTEADARIPLTQATAPGDASTVFIIAQPGSYYLTGNVSLSAGEVAIEVDSSDVTIDLNGYAIVGNSPLRGGGPQSTGILSGAILENLRIRNGSFRNLDGDAISLDRAENSVIEDLRIFNVRDGVRIGPLAQVRRVMVSGCDDGIEIVGDGVVADCVVRNADTAFESVGDVAFMRCVATSSQGGFLGDGSFTECLADACRSYGFAGSGTYTDCRAVGASEGSGFVVTGPSTLTACVAQGASDDGFNARDAVAVVFDRCVAEGCGDDGFQVGRDSVVTGCISTGNAYGFFGGSSADGGRIDANTASGNAIDGFLFVAPQGVLLVRNNAIDNGNDNYSIGSFNKAGIVYTQGGTLPETVSPWGNFSTQTVLRDSAPTGDGKGGADR
ncbi:MAG: right-handed parallel beta-helix repeat-containing protein [Planctomycetota bacterium]